jgi:hypothetical protein
MLTQTGFVTDAWLAIKTLTAEKILLAYNRRWPIEDMFNKCFKFNILCHLWATASACELLASKAKVKIGDDKTFVDIDDKIMLRASKYNP